MEKEISSGAVLGVVAVATVSIAIIAIGVVKAIKNKRK